MTAFLLLVGTTCKDNTFFGNEWNLVEKNDFFQFFNTSSAIFYTCWVWGNMSTGWMRRTV